jgi:hypothetical protein
MIPFRELEIFDSFMLDGRECEKIGHSKYLTYDARMEPRSLDSAEPNMMVELIDYDEELEHKEAVENENQFFLSLLNLLDGMEQQYEKAGEKLTIESLKQFAKDFLTMPKE